MCVIIIGDTAVSLHSVILLYSRHLSNAECAAVSYIIILLFAPNQSYYSKIVSYTRAVSPTYLSIMKPHPPTIMRVL